MSPFTCLWPHFKTSCSAYWLWPSSLAPPQPLKSYKSSIIYCATSTCQTLCYRPHIPSVLQSPQQRFDLGLTFIFQRRRLEEKRTGPTWSGAELRLRARAQHNAWHTQARDEHPPSERLKDSKAQAWVLSSTRTPESPPWGCILKIPLSGHVLFGIISLGPNF